MTPLLTGVFASQISGRLAPALTGSFDALGTITVPSGGLSSVTFQGIPQNYSHLQLRCLIKTTTNSNSDGGVYYRFNNDSSSSYSGHTLRGDGSAVSSYGGTGTAAGIGFTTGTNSNNTNTFATYTIDILDYNNLSKFKTTRGLEGYELNGVEGSAFLVSNNYRSFNAINRITFEGATFAQNSRFALYGVK
jgi:hypothetical protein